MQLLRISDEIFEQLKEFQKELKTQNNRATANPIYGIMEAESVVVPEGYGDEGFEWFDHERTESLGISDEELFNNLIEDEDREATIRKRLGELSSGELDYLTCDISIIRERFYDEIKYSNDLGSLGWSEIQKHFTKNIFKLTESGPLSFFEKDAFEHLEGNKHHYSDKAHTYAASLWRSPRMEKLREILIQLSLDAPVLPNGDKDHIMIYDQKELFERLDILGHGVRHMNNIVQNNIVQSVAEYRGWDERFTVTIQSLLKWRDDVRDMVRNNLITEKQAAEYSEILWKNQGRIPEFDK